jgi:hypothetical protein
MSTYDLTTFDFEKYMDSHGLSNKKMAKTIDGAMKKTADWARAQVAKEVSKAIKLPQAQVKKRVFAKKSRRYTLSSYVVMYPKPLNLIRFGARQTKHGVRSRVMSVPKVMNSKGKMVANSFIARTPQGKELVFKRRGAARLPIDPVTYAVKKQFEAAKSKVEAGGKIGERFEHELNRKLRAVKFSRR